MQRALEKLKYKPSIAYIDGPFAPKNAKVKCKTLWCNNITRIPPNRAQTATGYCRSCYYKQVKIRQAIKQEVRNNG